MDMGRIFWSAFNLSMPQDRELEATNFILLSSSTGLIRPQDDSDGGLHLNTSISNKVTKDERYNDDGNLQKGDHNRIAVFFNTYKPRNMASLHREHASMIIQSQLYMIQRQPLLQNATVYYTRFGDYKRQPIDFDEFCSSEAGELRAGPSSANATNNTYSNTSRHDEQLHQDKLHCIEIAAQRKGGENITLQAMYEYCTQYPEDTVVYLHSKGTHTVSRSNERLRLLLMRATLSDECLSLHNPTAMRRNHNNDHLQCDACSYQFTMWPSPHYAGNMFVARCDYIRKLIPPNVFEDKKQALVDRIMNSTKVVQREGDHFIMTATVQRSGTATQAVKTSSDTPPIAATHEGDPNLTNGTIQFVYNKRSEYQLNRETWLGRKYS